MSPSDPGSTQPGASAQGPSPFNEGDSGTPSSGSPETAALLEFSQRLAAALSHPARTGRLFAALAEGTAALADTDSAAVLLLEGGALRVQAGAGVLADFEGEWLPLEGSFEGASLLTRTLQRTTSLATHSHAYLTRELGLAAGAALSVPLLLEDEAIGALLLVRGPEEDPFHEREVERMGFAAPLVAAAVENRRSFDRARRSRERMERWHRERVPGEWWPRYEQALRITGHVVFEWSVASGELRWDRAVESVLGCTAEELGASVAEWLERVHPEDRERVSVQMAQAGQVDRLRMRVRVARPSGGYSPMWMQAGATDESSALWCGTLEDVAQLETVGRRAGGNGAGTPAKQVMRALRHEVNNPLAAILGEVQLLTREAAVQGDPRLRAAIETIQEEASRIQEVTRRLADLEGMPGDPVITRRGLLDFPLDES